FTLSGLLKAPTDFGGTPTEYPWVIDFEMMVNEGASVEEITQMAHFLVHLEKDYCLEDTITTQIGSDTGGGDGGDGETCSKDIDILVFEDLNQNGIHDGGEPGLDNWTVYIDENGDDQLDAEEPQAQTDSAGFVTFQNMPAGTYIIREVVESGWTLFYPDSSNNGEYEVVVECNNEIPLDFPGDLQIQAINIAPPQTLEFANIQNEDNGGGGSGSSGGGSGTSGGGGSTP